MTRAHLASLCLAWLAVGSRAQLRVIEGPPSLRDAPPLIAARYAFSPEHFVVRGELTLVTSADLDTQSKTAPPRVRADVRGRVAVLVDIELKGRSVESFARGLGDAGALAMLMFQHRELTFNPTPGRDKNFWAFGDSRELDRPVAASITQRAAVPLISALERGQRLAVEVRPSVTKWELMWASPWMALWRALLGLIAVAVIELAACRLWAFVRADGGVSLSIPQVLLAAEILLNVERVLVMALDPLHSTGLLPSVVGPMFSSLSVAMGTATTGLFLAYFAQASDDAGVALPRLQRRARFRHGVVGLGVASLAVDIVTSLGHLWHHAHWLRLAKIVLVLVAMPAVMCALAALTCARVSHRLRHALPAPLFSRLVYRMRLTVIFSFCALVPGLTLPLSLENPWSYLAVLFVFAASMGFSSYATVDAFCPMGRPPPVGPLRQLTVRAWRALRMLRVRLRSAPSQKEIAPSPRPSSISASMTTEMGTRDSPSELTNRMSSGSRAPLDRLSSPAGAARVIPAAPSSHDGRAARVAIWRQRPRTRHMLPTRVRIAAEGHSVAALEQTRELGRRWWAERARTAPLASAHSPPPPWMLLGVSRAYLRELGRSLGASADVTTHELGERALAAVGGETAGAQSIAECCVHAGACTADGAPAAGPARIFVSHAGGCPFWRLLDALDVHVQTHRLEEHELFFWLDVTSCRPAHVPASAVADVGQIERAIGSVVLVLEPWDSPLALERLWCLYEAVWPQLEGYQHIGLNVAFSSAQRAQFVRVLQNDRGAIERVLASVDAREAHAADVEDDRLIRELIELQFANDEGIDPYSAFHECVRTALRKALAAVSWHVF